LAEIVTPFAAINIIGYNLDIINGHNELAVEKQGLDYRQAGVDIEKGNQLVDNIKRVVKKTHRKEVLSTLGGFGGLFEVPIDRYRQPVLVSGTDGVGTKLRLAIDAQEYAGIGIDLVAMCVNDLLVCGAEPLYFLDYYATGQLKLAVAEQVIKSIAKGCELSGMALIGGETAEMPGMYQPGDFDLAGFAVGIVEKSKIIGGSDVNVGDKILAMASSGPHSNGYSLIRKIIDVSSLELNDKVEGKSVLAHLLEPTKLYVNEVACLQKACHVKALAHITGGGLTENLPRVLPESCNATIDLGSWQWPAIFDVLQSYGTISQQDMLLTFNCGIGMVAILDETEFAKAQETLKQFAIDSWCCGEIVASTSMQPKVIYV
jgi:phosphoribosylformylglycinamidine cyclo-ligase